MMKKKGRRPITRELYDLLLEGFRQSPGNISHASKVAGVVFRTAKRGWERGWVDQHEWAIPIKDQIALDRERLRIERARIAQIEREKQAEEREQARKDAAMARVEEAQAARQARVNALAMGRIISRIVLAASPLAEKIKKSLEDPTQTIPPRTAAQILRDCTIIVKTGNEAIRRALEIERIRVGNPLETLDLGIEEMTTEEAIEELESLGKTLERARTLGILEPLDPEDEQWDEGAEAPEEEDA